MVVHLLTAAKQCLFVTLLGLAAAWGIASAQVAPANQMQRLVFAGLRSLEGRGQFNAVATDAAGDIYVAFDQRDGVRVLKVSSDGQTVLAQTQLGAAGDVAVALTLDANGNVYIAGTSASGKLEGTAGAAMPDATAGTTSSFVARFDSGLKETFLTFTGGSRIAASAVAASGDAVFVTGITYGADLPATANAIQNAPAYASTQNGFVERFSADGATLVYATYITGAQGDTTPTGIATDALDDVWVVGSTSATGFPTIAALVPEMLSNPSGFLLRLTPAGDGIPFSTFVPGSGLSAVALDVTGSALLVSGTLALGQFPVDTALTPLVPTAYQVLLRMPLDGSGVQHGTVVAPGMGSVVAAAPDGGAWLGGAFTPGTGPFLPEAALSKIGTAYAVHVTASGAVDQTLRFGGLANQQQAFASIPTFVSGVSLDAAGALVLAGAAQPTASASLLASETYDFPLRQTPSSALPSTVKDAEIAANACSGSLCSGSGGMLAKVDPTHGSPALTFSADDLPFVVLRNLGTNAAENLVVANSVGSLTTNCPGTLDAGAECDVLLSGGGAGTLSASASNADTVSVAYPAYSTTPPVQSLVFFPKELDFGAVSAAGGTAPAELTITVTNLGSSVATFTSGVPVAPKTTSPFVEQSSDCALSPAATSKTLAAGATCHIVVALMPYASAASDGFQIAEWRIGTRQVLLTGYSQAKALSVSAAEIDFGTQIQGGAGSPRYLFVSNASQAAIGHIAIALPSNSPFQVTDDCPASLGAGSVCRLRIDYKAASAPSTDSASLLLDQGLQVLVSGKTLPPDLAGGSTVNPNLTVSPAQLTFADAVVVTGVSNLTQNVSIMNSGTTAIPLTVSVTGDFSAVSSCGSSLAAGATCAVALQFTPSSPGTRNGLLTVTPGDGSAPIAVSMSGSGTPILDANNGVLSFGPVPVGQALVQFYKISQPFNTLNVAATGPFRVTLVEDTGFGHGNPPVADFVTSGSGSCRNCWLAIRFQPTAASPQTGSVTLSSAVGGLPYALELTGSGIAASGLIANPSAMDFGAVPVNSISGLLAFSLTNQTAGGAAITLSAPTVSGPFAIGSSTADGVCGTSLDFGATCSVFLSFAPLATGSQSGGLTVSTSAGAVNVPLSGSGSADSGVGISPLALTFNNDGTSAATSQLVTLRNTGMVPFTVGAPRSHLAQFTTSTQCGTVPVGGGCMITVGFQPGTTPVSDALTIPVTLPGSSGAAMNSIYTVAVQGTYGSESAGLDVLPGSIEFGPTATSTLGPSREFTIFNHTAKTLAVKLPVPRNFSLAIGACATLAPGANCTFTLQFVPLINGDISGTVSVIGTPTDGTLPLTSLAYAEGFGVGTGSLNVFGGLIVQGTYGFGQVGEGQSKSHSFTFSNLGPAGSLITVHRVTSAPPFLATTTCGAALAAGQSCTATVTYSPAGAASGGAADMGSLVIESDAQSSPDVINLTGQNGGGSSAATPLATYSLSQGSLTFPPTTVGDQSPTQTVELANTGSVPIHVASILTSSNFTVQNGCATIAVGTSCNVSVSNTPQAAGMHLEALQIVSDAASALDFISLAADDEPSPLTFTPTSLNFGSVQVGATSVLPVQISNNGSAPVTFSSITATGDYTAASTCPAAGGALAPGASCTVAVTFAPTATGARPGTLMVASSASTAPLTVALSGSGTASQLVITPSSLAFGSIAVGGSANLSITLTNTGSAPATGLTIAAGGDFAVTTPCATTSLAPGASCAVQITFTPTIVGAEAGRLAVTSSDPQSPATIPLTGTGFANGDFALSVNGGPTASITITSGESATYALLLTPTSSFAGSVALTCAPLQTAQYASCSLLPPMVGLGAGSGSSAATINTIFKGAVMASSGPHRLQEHARSKLCLLLGGLLLMFPRRRNLRRWLTHGVALIAMGVTLALGGCAGGQPSDLHLTPPGNYHFLVTGSSTAGVQITHTVTLTLIVNPR